MMTASFDFSDSCVLVTGASRGIGLSVARGFAAAGAEVHLIATTEAVSTVAEQLCGETDSTVTGHVCDVTDQERVEAVFATLDHLDVLVSNAGVERPTPIQDAGAQSTATFRRIIDVNVLGTWYVTRCAVERMGRGARIVITSSIWGRTAVAEYSSYCASKHANLGFMRSLAQELGPLGINVNAVCPGWVRTDAAMSSLRQMAARSGRDEARMLEEIVAAQAMEGLMEPDDLAGPYLFLASEAAANITGQALIVDRGEVMG